MTRHARSVVFRFSLVALCCSAAWRQVAILGESSDALSVVGRVFHDRNENGKYDEGEPRLEGIRVSDGRQIVKTDSEGRWKLPRTGDAIYFVIKPRGWRTPISEHQLPRFYYLHKPAGSPAGLKHAGVAPTGPLPESIDFPLYPQNEPEQFRALLFGDPQPRDQKEIDYIAHDVIEELIGTDASFGVTLGDIMFDDLSLFESGAKTVAMLGIPWYNVIGNHDINTDARERRHANETFERVFGPSYYSFDYGPVHFLVLDDIQWLFNVETGKGRYQGGLGEEQMEFIRNDLAMIPENQLVVLMMHIPLVDVEDRHALYRLIEQRPFCMSISGHTHHHEHRLITRKDGWRGPAPHHHVINVTVSGSWWSGAPDERGIPHTTMADGGPNGYSIISFDGERYVLDYRVAGRPASYQMRIDLPEVVAPDSLAATELRVNVFNGSERSTVECRVDDGEWRALERRVAIDPFYAELSQRDNAAPGKSWRDLPKPKPSTHLWFGALPAELPSGVHRVDVRTRDMHGRTHEGHRVFRVE